jgi:hypothetical protein
VQTVSPEPLQLNLDDRGFLVALAKRILGNSSVAATTATRLMRDGIDAARVNALLPSSSVAVELDGFVFKKIAADEESPANYGLFVRRRGESASPFALNKREVAQHARGLLHL